MAGHGRNASDCAAPAPLHALRQGSKDVAVVVMLDKGQPWLKEAENIHSLYGLCVVRTNLATELRLLFTMTAIVP